MIQVPQHRDARYNRKGELIEPEIDEVFEFNDGEDMELLKECILELADIIYGQMEGEV